MNKKQTVKFCVLLMVVLLAVPVFANVLMPYETAAVSRIVGDDPSEMIQQLETQQSLANINKYLLKDTGNDAITSAIISLINKSDGFTQRHIDWSPFEKELLQISQQSPVLIIHGTGNVVNDEVWSYGDFIRKSLGLGYKPSDTNAWLNSFQSKKPIVLFDSDYAGLYLPAAKFKSFVRVLGQDSAFIAPTSVADSQFGLAVLCNLQKYDTLGELYKQARNNYYWGTSSPSGLALMSYQLLGNPFFRYSASGLDRDAVSKYCAALNKKYTITSALDDGEFKISSVQNHYKKSYELNLGQHNLLNFNNLTIINLENSEQRYEFGELVLPQKIILEKFPLNTIIKNYSAIEFEDPVDITAGSLGIWMGQLHKASCHDEKQQKEVAFAHMYTEDSILELITINPVDVLNCSEGKVRLYKKIKFEIEYLPYSPVQINSVDYPVEMLPGQKTIIKVNVINLKDSPAQGYLVLKQGTETVYVLPVNTTRDQYELELVAPSKEGRYSYRVDFYEGNESKTYTKFDIFVDVLEVNLLMPKLSNNVFETVVEIANKLDVLISTDLEYSVSHNGAEITRGTKSIQIKPGYNEVSLKLEGLDRAKEQYDLFVNIPYLGSNKLATSTIITNHAPVIIQDAVVIRENESFSISPEIYDVDGDDLLISIKYPFEDYDEDWVASFEQSGEYYVKITAEDGLKKTEKDVKLVILNTNRPPVIHPMDAITIKENETFTINLNFTDPDNENSVDNDDNNLTVFYAELFDENGTWTPDFDASGNYTVQVSVFDGEFYADAFVKIIVLNTNRPPVINVSEAITAFEGDLIKLDIAAYDPDNLNNVTNDDNDLVITASALFDENAAWQTTYEDAGNYTVTVTVSDGEYNVTKNVTIIVHNLNRPPEISGLKDIAVKEGDVVQLSPIVTDPDNQNNVTNDDNEITIIYPLPFDKNGTWQTKYDDSGEYNITVRASDGITESSQSIIIFVANTNRPPEIQPLPDINTREGQTITVTPVIRDPDNENNATNDDNQLTITYSKIIPPEGTVELSYESSGEYTITATVSDGELEANTSFRLKIDNVNRPPQVNVEDVHVKEGQTIDYTALIFDPDNENLVDNDDNDLIIHLPEQFKDRIWQISYEESGEYTFNIWAYDGEYNTSETIKVIVDNVNRPPTLEKIKDITAYEGEIIQINAVYSDPDNENSVTNDDNTLTIQYSPPLDNKGRWETNYFSAGTYDMTATVSDGQYKAVERFKITVLNQNRLPSIDSYEPETTVSVNEGESQVFRVNAKDPDLDELDLTWYLDGEQAGTGTEHKYTPSYADAGTHEIKVIAKDSEGGSAEHAWTVHVNNVNRPPEVKNIGTIEVPEGDEAVIEVDASDPDGDALSYSINDERFTQVQNVFRWQTTFLDSGVYDVEVTVSDGEVEVKQAIRIIVANFNHAPQILSYLPKNTQFIPHNKDVSFSITVFDPDNEELTTAWYVDEEIAGTGESFTFNAQGELKEFKIEAKVTDGNATTTQEFLVESIDRPKTDKFDEETTDLSEYSEEELTSVPEFTLQKGNAKIKFLENIDLSSAADLENNIILQDKLIALNSPELPALNKPARLTFYNTGFTQNPVIYYASGFTADAGSVDEICPPEVCYGLQYKNGVLSFTAAHFTTYVVRETPLKQHYLQVPEKIVIDAGGSVLDEFTIRNSGMHNLENLEITGMFTQGSFVFTPSKTSLGRGEAKSIKIEGVVQRPLRPGRTEIGQIIIKNKDAAQVIPVYLDLQEKLDISRLDISVGDRVYSNVKDKDKIKIRPGSHVELDLDIKNNFEEKISIEYITVSAEIERISAHDDSDRFSVTAGNYRSKILELDIPKALDRNSYDLLVTVEGEDEKGTVYEVQWSVKLQVDREKHSTKIEGLKISPAELKCSKEALLSFSLANYGTAGEENIKILVQNPELGIDVQDYVSVQKASETEFRYRIIFDDYQDAGTHNIPVKVYYDDSQLADSKEITLGVLECGAKQASNENAAATVKVQTVTSLDSSRPVIREQGDDTLVLTSMLLILLALLAVLAGLLFIKAVY